MALVNHKGRSEIARIDLVGAEKVKNFDVAGFASGDDAAHIASSGSRHKAEIEAADPGGGAVQNIEPVPIIANQPAIFGDAPGRAQNAGAVGSGERPLPHYDHRVLGIAQNIGPGVVARSQSVQHGAVIAQHLDGKCQVEGGPDRRDPETALEIALAQPRIDERRLPARVGADQQTGIRVFDAGNCRVEQICGAAPRVEPGAVLAAIEARRAEAGEKLLQREHRLGVA